MKSGELVQIGSGAKTARPEAEGVSRRSFLKILGTSSALGVAGCADDARQNIFPYVKGEVEQIPGYAVWYRSTCRECEAGCGVQVRTREGRAVKVEGSPDSPINRGGLCALGQSSLQSLYDPDRVRQPLKRVRIESNGKPIFEPIGWDEAYTLIANQLSGGGKKAFLCGELSGTTSELLNAFGQSFGVDRVVYDPFQPAALAKASELVFGKRGIPHYQLADADAVLTLSADVFETFVSPVEYARDWAKTRKGEKPVLMISAEPRLSLTGANADLWLCIRPGTELQLALFISRKLLEDGRAGIPDEAKTLILEKSEGLTAERVSSLTGVRQEDLNRAYDLLKASKQGLVIAGGMTATTPQAVQLQVVSLILSVQLGALDRAMKLDQMRQVQGSIERFAALKESIKRQEISTLFLFEANPVFTQPNGFADILRQVPLVVSFQSHRNASSDCAHVILPSHTWLESWGDYVPYDGLYSLLQPAMAPVFDTRPIGDSLLELARRAGKAIKTDGFEAKSFEEFLKNSWKKIHAKARGVNADFEAFWKECVERGGYFPGAQGAPGAKVALNQSVKALDFAPLPSTTDATLIPIQTVVSFDGRAANRPWLQELPDPITKVVWDSWAEIHPDTAKELGVEKGDIVSVRTQAGALELPVFITARIFKGAVAVPFGQGQENSGRYAAKVPTSANAFAILPESAVQGDTYTLLTQVKVSRSRGRSEMVVMQGSFTQHGRELARTAYVTPGSGEPIEAHHAEHHHKSDQQFYEQRDHPLYQWGMAIDLGACTGCSACVVACYAENNVPVVGKEQCAKGREMSWLRIETFDDGSAEELSVSFLPMLCQHCHNAPCEPVCPVFAAYHNEEGLNAQVYNRCVGTRYCSNNCPYKVRRFNWYQYDEPTPLNWQLNPDVVKRSVGVMEKCTFCIQRIIEAKDTAKDIGRLVKDGEVQPACVQGCPTKALTFGNMSDSQSELVRLMKEKRAYKVLDEHVNTQPAITYLERVRYKV